MAVTSGNFWLNQEQMEGNASYIWEKLSAQGWTIQAVSGMLGNMQSESTINPGIWQNLDPSNPELGYGLTQWTPSTKYTDWCAQQGLNPSDMDSALARINWELENGQQYYPTDQYPLTFAEFKVSTQTPYYLAGAFLYNYERPAEPNPDLRGTRANTWYEYLTGQPGPGPGPGPSPGKPFIPKPMKLIYYLKRRL